jgi:outer membrane protein assembly factor BamD
MPTRLSALLLASLLGVACSSGSADLTKPVTGAEASNAGKAYEAGMKDRKLQNFVEATRYFEYVKNNFPYSQYAALSSLALADMSFDHDDWNQAAAAYSDFVKGHPSHPQAGYAAYRVALAHYNDRPSDWFLLPPSYEKDQGPLRAALDAYNRFLATYPKSEFVPKAQIEENDCRERLVAHDRYVAGFYEKRSEWRGAAGRYLAIADSFGDLHEGHLRADALWAAAEDYRKANDPATQRAILVRFVQDAPSDPRRPQAETKIAAIPADVVSPPIQPLPLPGQKTFKPIAPKTATAPITPAETPNVPTERPASAPPPGEPPGQALQPGAPETSPKPAQPTNQPEKPPEQPVSQPPTPPLAPPDR